MPGERGQAVLLVLVLAMAIFLAGWSAVLLAERAGQNVALEAERSRASYIAEAGVEKALAAVVEHPAWFRSLPPGVAYDFLKNDLKSPQYGGGCWQTITVTRLQEDLVSADLKVVATGSFRSASSSVTVTAVVYNLYLDRLFGGVWIDGSCSVGSGVAIKADLYVREDLTLAAGSACDGDVFCGGRVFLKEGSGEALTRVGGDLYTPDEIQLQGSKVDVQGHLYVSSLDDVPALLKDRAEVLPAADLLRLVPGAAAVLPCLHQMKWFHDGADYRRLPEDLAFAPGVYYIDHDLNLSGCYTGQALIVVNGRVTLTGDLLKSGTADGLAIIASDLIAGVQPGQVVEALLCSQKGVSLQRDTAVRGSLVTPVIDSGGQPVSLVYDGSLVETIANQWNWAISCIAIKSWNLC